MVITEHQSSTVEKRAGVTISASRAAEQLECEQEAVGGESRSWAGKSRPEGCGVVSEAQGNVGDRVLGYFVYQAPRGSSAKLGMHLTDYDTLVQHLPVDRWGVKFVEIRSQDFMWCMWHTRHITPLQHHKY